ncbi:hypothetical protein B4168_1129 [Anoxybacillus flavithermus]|nr:hypothetical protein B4168_1129 [Anoxybacillus flavithermus]OAO88228.1 hypothetical protein GT23_0504 [Parageobacillus thermoglucosidasius]
MGTAAKWLIVREAASAKQIFICTFAILLFIFDSNLHM